MTVLAVAALLLVGCGGRAAPDGASSAAGEPVPRYEILGKKKYPLDEDRPELYVVVDPVDLTDDGFKERVKRVLLAIAREQGTPDFSATVYDDADAAAWAYDFYENGPESCELGQESCQIPESEQANADRMNDLADRHTVAYYSGGYRTSTSSFPYELSWYSRLPMEAVDTGDEVRYEADEKWRPMPDPTTPPPEPPTAEPLNGTFSYVPPYANGETWEITSTCDAATGDCTGEVTYPHGDTSALRRTNFGPWEWDRLDSTVGWDCGLHYAGPFYGRKADIHYTYDADTRRGTVTWVAPRGTCMPDEQTYRTTFIFK